MALTQAAQRGIHTFVIGIATGPDAAQTLNDMATAGKEPRPGNTKYYPAGSQADLVTAINTIAGQIVSCSFPLQMAPQYPDFVDVRAGGQRVPKDTSHMNGWDYGPSNQSVLFYGNWCSMLQSGSIPAVQAIFGCGPIS
jgi:hypothetical protein